MHVYAVVLPPVGVSGAPNGFGESVALAESARLFVDRREATHFPVLVHRITNPLYLGVASDGLVERINADHLKVLVRAVLTHPVTVQHPQSLAAPANSLLWIDFLI